MKILLLIPCFFLLVSPVRAQSIPRDVLVVLRIQLISEHDLNDAGIAQFEQLIKEEIQTVMLNRKHVVFESNYCKCGAVQLSKIMEDAFDDSEVDMVIAIGPLASAVLSKKKSFAKPAIASLIIDQKTQQVPMTETGTSGIPNFTYILSPFSFEKDLQLLHCVFPFKKVGIIAPPNAGAVLPGMNDLLNSTVRKLGTDMVILENGADAASRLAQIPTDVDAVYVLPLFNEFSAAEYKKLFDGLAQKKLPSVALLGERMVEIGAMLGYESGPNLARMPRRIALNISKIEEGINASALPVHINTYSENVVINMNTVRQVGAYPDWDLMTGATLLNANVPTTDETWSLQSTIMLALQENLELQTAQQNPLIAGQEVNLARANLLPQMDVSSSIYTLDENTAANSFGTRGRTNWVAGANLSQIVFAEPALANVAIQKLLKKGEEAGVQTTQLDIVLDAVEGYLNVLQAKSFVEIQSANVGVTKSNLDIAQAKDSVGYSGATDMNRWVAQLALSKIDLNDAQTQLRQAKYALNQVLNKDIKGDFNVENISLDNNLLMATDSRMLNKINNEKELNLLSDFLVNEAMNNLPELREFDYIIAAQQRLALSQKRAFYAPTFGLSGAYDHTLQRWDVKESVLGPAGDPEPSWNIGLGAQFPIFQGGARKHNLQKTQLEIMQVQTQKADARNQLELRVRVYLQDAVASYFEVQRFKEASAAASANFDIVQDAYQQGLANITSLIDAQNAKVQTAIGLASANYQFILDFFEVERAIGNYYTLISPAERDAFFNRLNAFMN
jgi:outer membrane protein TolC